MAAGDLTTSAAALQWIGLPSDDGTVARLITAVSAQIQKFLGYQVASASYTRTFNGIGGRKLMLPERPVTGVSSVTVDTVSIPAGAPPNPGYLFDSKSVYLSGFYEFCRGVQNVQIVYTAGYASTPGDIEQACLDWIKLTHDSLDTLPGLKSIRAGDSQLEYGSATTSLGHSTLLMPPGVAAILQPHRRVGMA